MTCCQLELFPKTELDLLREEVSELKKRLDGSTEMIGFALGWLAREDKVDISQDKKKFKVTLR